jgi:UDP-N-acetylglucosamine--N-acetylmuramyl-(pentapeptide) pyrophosphoryl-undecaprenol N-acetylglucosamine transferase
MALVSKEAAVLVSDRKADTDLIPQVLKLVADASAREHLSKAMIGFALPSAAEDIANEIYQLSGK